MINFTPYIFPISFLIDNIYLNLKLPLYYLNPYVLSCIWGQSLLNVVCV